MIYRYESLPSFKEDQSVQSKKMFLSLEIKAIKWQQPVETVQHQLS